MKNILTLFTILLFIVGCVSRMNIKTAEEQGADALNSSQIKRLVTGNSIYMESWDKAEKADVEFSRKGGILTINNKLGGKTIGRFRVSNDRLCLQYNTYGDDAGQECNIVVKLADKYLLFRPDGTLSMRFIPNHNENNNSDVDVNVGVMGQLPSQWTKSEKKSAPKIKKVVATTPSIYPSSPTTPQPSVTIGAAATSMSASQEFTPQVAKEHKMTSHHRLLIKTGECPGCDLTGIDFSHTSLDGAHLEGADLSGSKFEQCDLSGAYLQGANLQGAILTDADLTDANLQNANLDNANLHWADLSEADLRHASLKHAYLVKTIFYKADLRGADMSDVVSQRTIFNKAKGVPFELVKKNTPWTKKN